MSVEEWKPVQKIIIDLAKLRQYVAIASNFDDSNVAAALPVENISADSFLMSAAAADWAQADELNSDDISNLIRFFTLAEMQLPGWEAGKSSPVIYLFKLLRKKTDVDAEALKALRSWIKTNSDNRYLPNGAVI